MVMVMLAKIVSVTTVSAYEDGHFNGAQTCNCFSIDLHYSF